jgi:hypothetical protein
MDIAALGLPAAHGLAFTENFYWDMNDSNRAWTKRWQAERPTRGHRQPGGPRRRLGARSCSYTSHTAAVLNASYGANDSTGTHP